MRLASAFVDVNERTARLASIIPLIRGDYVPQSFVEVDPDLSESDDRGL